MDGKKYEKKVASYLKRKGFFAVKVTGESGDYGVDVLARKNIHKYAVQCKYYSRPVGVHAVQQVVGGMKYYKCDRAIVITNNTFTRQARALASENNVKLIAGYDGREGVRWVLFTLFVLVTVIFIYLFKTRVF
ncbi:MAG: restriction endonuclease [Clostridiales bacterium]|nr:restriction endonuclease [Clostridiales bacterium]